MNKIVTVKVEIGGLVIEKRLEDAWSGDNPRHHALETEKAIQRVTSQISNLLASHYGDIRDKEL